LVIAYRELRELEIAVLKELHPGEQRVTDIGLYTKVDVDRFYGIEISEFPARIAEVAMWMMDHIMNARLSAAFGESFVRIPLKTSPNILNADALETDWANVLAPEECSYILGNPPFGGAKYQMPARRKQVMCIAALGGSGGTLDYVCAWFIKAGEYVRQGKARIGFVATNSITQGEQVAQVWPLLFEHYGLEIAFAHRTFAWMSDARGKAHVHCVIISLTRRDDEPKEKRLFTYDDIKSDPKESRHAALSPYLFDSSGLVDRHLVVREISAPLCDAPKMITGTQPIDGGNLIFDATEYADFTASEPQAEKFLHPFPGTEEFINGIPRWILAVQNATPTELRSLVRVRDRLRLVKEFRQKSKRKSTLKIADYATKFNVETIPLVPFLVVPEVSSEKRDYVPIGWLKPPVIPSNKLRLIEHAQLWQFGILTSAMHMAWTRIDGGRLESRYQYSVGINYNPFPWPQLDEAAKQNSKSLRKPCSTRARLMPARRSPTSTIQTSCRRIWARRIARSTRRSIGCIARRLLRATASGWSIFSACTKNSPRRCSPRSPNPSAAGKSEGRAFELSRDDGRDYFQ
jgi:hypothetical protein